MLSNLMTQCESSSVWYVDRVAENKGAGDTAEAAEWYRAKETAEGNQQT